MHGLRNLLGLVLLPAAISAITLPVGTAPHGQARTGNPHAIDEALRWLSAPPHIDAEYNFELTVNIRLLFLWTAKDDVGGGYIKVGEAEGDPSREVIRLLFGSDPAKAHGINRWGAGTEVARRGPGDAVESSAFFGFMKSSQGESAGAMQQEISREKQQGQYRFEAIISRVDAGRAVSTTVPFYADRDFTFRELEPAERTVLEQIQDGQARQLHSLAGTAPVCGRSNGFLSTVQELAGRALDQQQGPASLCYVYNSKEYILALDGVRSVPDKSVHFTLAGARQVYERYRDLREARFHVLNRATGKKTYFTILLGTAGGLRGAPVQIQYQPNWWFRITLNLLQPDGQTASAR
jgi:hypothetical protein